MTTRIATTRLVHTTAHVTVVTVAMVITAQTSTNVAGSMVAMSTRHATISLVRTNASVSRDLKTVMAMAKTAQPSTDARRT